MNLKLTGRQLRAQCMCTRGVTATMSQIEEFMEAPFSDAKRKSKETNCKHCPDASMIEAMLRNYLKFLLRIPQKPHLQGFQPANRASFGAATGKLGAKGQVCGFTYCAADSSKRIQGCCPQEFLARGRVSTSPEALLDIRVCSL